MPEGDTVYKIAEFLRPLISEQEMEAVLVRGVFGSERLAGSRVLQVEALGKHLVVHFDCERQLRVHLGMSGSWHRYKPGAPWKRSKNTAAVVLTTRRDVLVCFNTLEVEIFPSAQRKWHKQLNALGPDLLAPEEPDWDAIVARARRHHPGEALLGEVLLDQRVAAGIGNVYKSELAFLGPPGNSAFEVGPRALHPWLPLGRTTTPDLRGLYQRARVLLQANLGGWRRTTRYDRRKGERPGDRLYVYNRAHERCYRCGGVITTAHQGLQNRPTYWCPACTGPNPF